MPLFLLPMHTKVCEFDTTSSFIRFLLPSCLSLDGVLTETTTFNDEYQTEFSHFSDMEKEQIPPTPLIFLALNFHYFFVPKFMPISGCNAAQVFVFTVIKPHKHSLTPLKFPSPNVVGATLAI